MHFLFRDSSTLALRTPLLDNILLPAIRARRWTGSALRRALFVTLPAVLAVCWSGPARGQTNVLSVVRPLDGYTQGATTNALVQVGGNFYGTTVDGGSNNIGTVYQLTPQGIYTLLYSFTGGSDGSVPQALTAGNNGNLYGVTNSDATNGSTFFEITTAGLLTTLYTFTDGVPYGPLTRALDGNFYGFTQGGGTNSAGTFFRIDPLGGYTLVASLSRTSGLSPTNRRREFTK